MMHVLTRGFLIAAAIAVPSITIAHGSGPGGAQAPGWSGQQTAPCAIPGAAVQPCGTAPGTEAYGPWGNGMSGPAAGHGPQMMQGFDGTPRQDGSWGPGHSHGPGMNWRD